MKFLHRFFATWFFSGYIPMAPGTWGSLAAAVIWWYIPLSVIIQIPLIISICIFGIYVSGRFAGEIHNTDPAEIVIDEVAGMWLALVLAPHNILYFLAAFIIFRLLDIFKPLFIDALQDFSGGLGIMLDDIAAGFITMVIMQGVRIIL